MSTGPRLRVVVADDHRQMREAVAGILSRRFDVVDVVSTGAAAVDSSSRLDPDVVVLDVAMPGLDGFQTAAQLKASGCGALIVFLSNYAGDDYVLAGISRGASAFVAKSSMERDLIAAVDHAKAGHTCVPSAAVLPRWRHRPRPWHDVQLYATDAFLVDAVAAFFETALEAGDSIIAVASEPHREALDAQFGARGLDVASLVATGRYISIDASAALEAILIDGTPDRLRFGAAFDPLFERAVTAAPGAHVSSFGEIAQILCDQGKLDAMTRLERIAGEYTLPRPLSILCGYSTARRADDSIDLAPRICAEHSAIVPADSKS